MIDMYLLADNKMVRNGLRCAFAFPPLWRCVRHLARECRTAAMSPFTAHDRARARPRTPTVSQRHRRCEKLRQTPVENMNASSITYLHSVISNLLPLRLQDMAHIAIGFCNLQPYVELKFCF